MSHEGTADLVERIRRALEKVRLWVARVVVPGGFYVGCAPTLRETACAFQDLRRTTETSGHLLRERHFHVGRRLREQITYAQRCLLAVETEAAAVLRALEGEQ